MVVNVYILITVPTGDTIYIVAEISNPTSKEIRPKACLFQKSFYEAAGNSCSAHRSLCKMVGDVVPAHSNKTVAFQLRIPDDATPTFYTDIIGVNYSVKVGTSQRNVDWIAKRESTFILSYFHVVDPLRIFFSNVKTSHSDLINPICLFFQLVFDK